MEAFSIAILAFDGVDELDVVGPFEVFARVAQKRPGVSVSIASVNGERELVGAYGLQFGTDGPLVQTPDLLVIPGGGWVAQAPRGVRAEIARGDLPRLIAEAHASQVRIASVCTGDNRRCARRRRRRNFQQRRRHPRHRPRALAGRTLLRRRSLRIDRDNAGISAHGVDLGVPGDARRDGDLAPALVGSSSTKDGGFGRSPKREGFDVSRTHYGNRVRVVPERSTSATAR